MNILCLQSFGFRSRPVPVLVGGLLCLLTLCGGCGRGSTSGGAEVVARVGSVTLTVQDLKAESERRGRMGLPALDPGELVESWVRQQVLLTRARESGLDRDPEMQRRMERVLAARMEEPLEERLRGLESVGAAEVEAYHRQHAGEFMSPEQFRVAQIWFRVPPGATPEQRREVRGRAEAALAEARTDDASGEIFAALARRHSDDRATWYTGGDCGWVARGAGLPSWPGESLAAVFSLDRTGAVSGVVESADGFRLFRLMARKNAEPRPLDEVREQIVHRLQRERRDAAIRQFHESLRAGLDIEVRPDAVAPFRTESAALARRPEPPSLPAH